MSTALLLDSGPGAAAFNMALDEALLETAPFLGRAVLRFYGWTEPAASFGYFQSYAQVEALTPLRPLVRRPTAGGIVPHDADWTYSLVFPANHPWYALRAAESYRGAHSWLQAAFARLGVAAELAPCRCKSQAGQCFIGYEKSDLLWRGRKIAGAAQRRTRNGLLIQGSVQPPPVGLARADWHHAMRATAPFDPPVQWVEFSPDPPLQKRALELAAAKFALPAYNRKR
ncbi:MAG: biotin/lipoate A/B protein ligase family protein [Limisphaerales bacterium]